LSKARLAVEANTRELSKGKANMLVVKSKGIKQAGKVIEANKRANGNEQQRRAATTTRVCVKGCQQQQSNCARKGASKETT
jgi:hypothetical protein